MRLPRILVDATDPHRQREYAARTLGELVASLAADLPVEPRHRLLDDDGRLRNHVNAYVNGQDVRFLAGSETALSDTDEVTFIPAIAGGCGPA